MRVTIIHAAAFASPYGGNFVASIRALGKSCEEQGWQFVLALPPDAERRSWCTRMMDEGYRVRFLSEDTSVTANARELAGLALATDVAVIHTHFSQYDVAALVAQYLLRLRRRRVRIVWHAHSDFPAQETVSRWAKNIVKYRLMGRGARMIAVSEHIRERMIAAGFNPTAASTIRNGIDVGRASAANRTRQEMLEELRVSADACVLLLFGWEPIVKGVDVAMSAVATLADLGLPVILVVVGTAPLEEFVIEATQGVPPPWLRVVSPTDDVADLYLVASVFLSASRNEGFPYSVCEAMVNHLPVVLSDLPGVSWARRTPGAVFVPPGDPVALAGAIREVLGWRAEEREARVAASDQLVTTEFGVSIWVERILDLYRGLLDRYSDRLPA